MTRTARQTVGILVAMAMLAAPVVSCCLGFAGNAHAAAGTGEPSHPDPDGAMHQDCGGEGDASAPMPKHDVTCDGCSICDGVLLKAQPVAAGSMGAPADPDMALFTVIAHSRPDFMPALLRTAAPPHGPPPLHRTPVYLSTTLRL